ncbi:precorrin-8X methylmutase [Pseudohoeflea coraliihabitans]|uniref:Precorrin-8X methylmutase n=1 Tax=Pseudohoeflea coraliihabitans TaxID=2860393 RepID=A0ABS6WIH4_9HYPH|nr:precorrin-8X methylmutase [Pseudohoeflea sp. DP4N28-3]MBW3095747.1 precorrin-8X methylmutase [Pseudohoeflea sp. DP4N28-3]
MAHAYERRPDAIYQQSFAIIRAETDLTRFDAATAAVVVRMIHACGMVDLVSDIAVSPDFAAAGQAALARGAPILCDVEMVKHGIIKRLLGAGNPLVSLIGTPAVAQRAEALATTRSAAQVDIWGEQLGGAVVVIGNAPTALFRLLERLDEGAPKPGAIIGLPVGFVGAAESKAELSGNPRGVPFLTVEGRRGGSAMAAAALNGLAAGLEGHG